MSEPATAMTKSPRKKATAKLKNPADHPPYFQMIKVAIETLKERNGSSRQAIEKYIKGNFKVAAVGAHLKMAFKRAVANGKLINTKGVGTCGSFKLSKEIKKRKGTEEEACCKEARYQSKEAYRQGSCR